MEEEERGRKGRAEGRGERVEALFGRELCLFNPKCQVSCSKDQCFVFCRLIVKERIKMQTRAQASNALSSPPKMPVP